MDDSELHFSFKAYRRPFRSPLWTSRGRWAAREGILIRLEREDGAVSYGEIAPIDWFGTETFVGALAWCGGVPERCMADTLGEIPPGYVCCQSAVGSALDGFLPVTAEIAEPLGVASLLSGGMDAIEALEGEIARGFRVFKLKIGVATPGEEQDFVNRVVERLPDGCQIRLDANGGLDVRTAAGWVEAAEEWPVEFLEQPLSSDEADELSALARDTPVPIALDESVLTADEIKRWRDREWNGIFVIKPSLAGSLSELSQEIAVDPSAFVISSALESNVGMSVAIDLAFKTGIERALGYGTVLFFPEDGLGGSLTQPRVDREMFNSIRVEDVWNLL